MSLAKLQRVLGEYNDSFVRAAMFADLVTRGKRVPAATSFLVGRLVERDQRKLEKCRRRFAKSYGRIKGRRWRALAQAMRERARSTGAPATMASVS